MITFEEPTTQQEEPPMPEKKTTKPRGVAINLPKTMADEISSLSTELGIQKSKIRRWVTDYAIAGIETVGIRQIVADRLRPLFKDPTAGSE